MKFGADKSHETIAKTKFNKFYTNVS